MRRLVAVAVLMVSCAEPVFAQAPDIKARTLTLVNDAGQEAVRFELARNNQTPQRTGRLAISFLGSFPGEVQVEPGPDADSTSAIVSQILLYGLRPSSGGGRARAEMTIAADASKGQSMVVGSTLAGGAGRVMPLVFNADDGVSYVTLHPSDRTVEFQDRTAGADVRIPLATLISRIQSATVPAVRVEDSAKIAALEARIAKLEAALGPYGDSVPPTSNFAARCPELPNGRYSVWCRVQQIGMGIDGNNVAVSGIASRLAVVESVSAGGQPVGTAVFDKIRVNRICVGELDCDADWPAQLQVRGLNDAVIGFESNLAFTDPQDATHSHIGQVGISRDGGTRSQQNARTSFSRGFITYVNPCRPWVNFGPDSRGDLSLYKGSVDEPSCTAIAHDASQDLVYKPDEATKEIRLFLPRPLWNIRIQGSSSVNAGDLTLQPKQ